MGMKLTIPKSVRIYNSEVIAMGKNFLMERENIDKILGALYKLRENIDELIKLG